MRLRRDGCNVLAVNLGVRHQPRFFLSINRTLILGIITAAAVACVSKNDSTRISQSLDTSRTNAVVAPLDSAPAAPKPTVRLVDFAIHEIMADSVAKVEVTAGSAVDTIPGLFTSLSPIATNDGMIHGIAMTAGGEAKNGYDYDSRTRKLTLFPLPSDVSGFFHEIELNNDAKYVAYVAHVQSGQTWAVVRSWPSMTLVARTAPSEGYPSDVGYDQVAWLGPYRFQISYRIGSGPSVVAEGDPRSTRMKVDTVSKPQNE
jgi:hypothetical protein